MKTNNHAESLSDKIEVVGFHTEIEFKDKDGNIKLVSARKGEEGLKVKDVKEFIQDILKDIKELPYNYKSYDKIKEVINKRAGEELINHSPQNTELNMSVGKREDTKKGCGKEFETDSGIEICDRFYSCPKCSGAEE